MSYTIDKKTWRSPNFSSRNGVPITTAAVHSCEGRLPTPRSTSLPWLCNPASEVSSHYYVCRDTTIFQLVDDDNEAWHAGAAQTAYQNPRSLGVECEHRAGQDWPGAQKNALAWLLQQLTTTHSILLTHIDTHGQVAIKGPYQRKLDPTDWPHAEFIAWRNALAVAKRYRILGMPVYERSDHVGPLWGHLAPGQTIEIDDPNNGHIARVDGQPAPIGFIRFDPDTLEALP